MTTGRRWIHGVLVLVLLLGVQVGTARSALAQDEVEFVLGETSVVVPANGEATLEFQTFCMDFGKAFPTALGTPDGRAEDDVLSVIRAGLEQQIAEAKPLAVQLAIWSLREETDVAALYPDSDLDAVEDAMKLLDADSSVSPLRTDRGIALDTAVADGMIEATSSNFTFVDAEQPRPDGEPYHGTGTLTLRNLTDGDLEIYFPFGTVFRAADESEQDIVAYATELEQQVTPQVMPETGSSAPNPLPLVLAGLALAAAGLLIQRRLPAGRRL